MLKHYFKNKKVLLITTPILLLGSGLLLISKSPSSQTYSGQTYTVSLEENGFKPNEISIKAGDTIKFTTTRGKPFWPASNLHPTHEIYPQFDPKQPINPTDSWSFRFDKEGQWQYHDHLFPYYTGVVKVSSVGKTLGKSSTCEASTNRQECWATSVESALKEKDLEAAFDLVADIYSSNPEAAETCHNLVHKIGQAAFKLFSAHQEFKVTPKAAFCNFGFYHGFMESLVVSGEDLKKAGAFCSYIDKQLKESSKNSVLQCYHGIGHGTVNSHDPNTWGREQAMIQPAIKLCEDVATNSQELFRCVSGVYNGIGNFYVTGDYKLIVKKDDPFWICRQESNKVYAEACYGNLHPTITWIANKNLSQAIRLFEEVSDDRFATIAMSYVAGDFARFSINKTDFSSEISTCRNAQPRLSWTCIIGFATGLMDQGKPNYEYVTALAFCRSSTLQPQEQDRCFEYSLQYLSTMYTSQKYQEVCRTVEDSYQKYCTK
jgi:plastocyanin